MASFLCMHALAPPPPTTSSAPFAKVATGSGATVRSHVNDSGFWLVGRFLGMDEKTTLKTWTVMETILGSVGFLIAFALSLVL